MFLFYYFQYILLKCMVVQYSTYRMIQYASTTIDWYNQKYCTHRIADPCRARSVLAERLGVLLVESCKNKLYACFIKELIISLIRANSYTEKTVLGTYIRNSQ